MLLIMVREIIVFQLPVVELLIGLQTVVLFGEIVMVVQVIRGQHQYVLMFSHTTILVQHFMLGF